MCYLALVKDFLCDLVLQRLRRLLVLQNLILAEGQKPLEEVLANREPKDELFPRKAWSVEEDG